MQKLGGDGGAKLNDLLKESTGSITKHLDEATNKSTEHLTGVINAAIILSRADKLPEGELDERLGKLLPPKVIDIVKEQQKLLPEDPYMGAIKEMTEKLTKIEERLAAIEAAGKK